MKLLIKILILIPFLFSFQSCAKENKDLPEKKDIPVISTKEVTNVTLSGAISGGDVINDGGATLISRGVCWNTSADPTIYNSKTIESGTQTSYTSNMLQLMPNTTYFVRAYATNSVGTSYGESKSFITYALTDIDSNYYHTVTIGTQTWLTENLKTTRYNNGIAIPLILDHDKWTAATTNAYCYYNNDIANKEIYGALYNWMVVDRWMSGNNNVCPAGWHVPAKAEWTVLFDFLTNNGFGYGQSMDETAKALAASSGWSSDSHSGNVGNDQATNNKSGFNALPGGEKGESFAGLGSVGGWWAVPDDYGLAYSYWDNLIYYNSSMVIRANTSWNTGLSIRCLKLKLAD